jgi:hypothetical protein
MFCLCRLIILYFWWWRPPIDSHINTVVPDACAYPVKMAGRLTNAYEQLTVNCKKYTLSRQIFRINSSAYLKVAVLEEIWWFLQRKFVIKATENHALSKNFRRHLVFRGCPLITFLRRCPYILPLHTHSNTIIGRHIVKYILLRGKTSNNCRYLGEMVTKKCHFDIEFS